MAEMVNIPYQKGSIIGCVHTSITNKEYCSFRGIPYAVPPVGDLRFKAPMPIKKCKGILDATKDPPQCYQRHMIRLEEVSGDEDCLYLNVYKPKVVAEDTRLPVMVWIHGGAFVCGSSKIQSCGPSFLMTQDVVLVTFNYRLGMLGFMSFEDPTLEVTGNAGLKDQVLVLKWVQHNIKQFNGDKNNVTLFGHDAGAACVHLHMLSPMSRCLFHKAIMQSGCALNPWVNGVMGSGRMIAKVLGYTGDDKELLSQLRELSVKVIYLAQEQLTNDNMVNTKWFCSPIVETQKYPEPFLPDQPINIIRSGNYAKVPFIIGYTVREGIYWDLLNRKIIGKPKIINDFSQAIPNNLYCNKNSLLSKTIHNRIENFYFGERTQQSRIGRYPRLRKMDPLYQLFTDVFFLRGIFVTIKNHLEVNHRIPIFYYKFTFETGLNAFKKMLPKIHRRKYPGTIHGDDVFYLFETDMTPAIYTNSKEMFAIKRMVNMWTNFARTGDPACESFPTGLIWTSTTKTNFQCLNISEKFETEYNPDMERMCFWDIVYHNDARTQHL